MALSLLQRGLAPRSKGKARAELRPARRSKYVQIPPYWELGSQHEVLEESNIQCIELTFPVIRSEVEASHDLLLFLREWPLLCGSLW